MTISDCLKLFFLSALTVSVHASTQLMHSKESKSGCAIMNKNLTTMAVQCMQLMLYPDFAFLGVH